VPSYPPRLHAPGGVLELHPRSTLRAVAHRHRVGGLSAVAFIARGVPVVPAAVEECSLSHLLSTPRAVAREAGVIVGSSLGCGWLVLSRGVALGVGVVYQ
jgi:hypothetical protein